jgi:hypothetical protein
VIQQHLYAITAAIKPSGLVAAMFVALAAVPLAVAKKEFTFQVSDEAFKLMRLITSRRYSLSQQFIGKKMISFKL